MVDRREPQRQLAHVARAQAMQIGGDQRLRDPGRWWERDNVNPYPLLAGDYAQRSTASRERR